MSRLGAAIGLVVVLGAGASAPLAAQVPPSPAATDPFRETLFEPELIMQHRRAIGLTDEQRDAISRLIQDLQGRVVGLQWQLLDEVQTLTEILSATEVDLDRALDHMDGVLDLENQVKRAHLELLVRIKNLLEPGQIERLRSLRQGSG